MPPVGSLLPAVIHTGLLRLKSLVSAYRVATINTPLTHALSNSGNSLTMQNSDRPLRLNGIVNQTDTRAGKAFDLAVQGLIIVSVISFLSNFVRPEKTYTILLLKMQEAALSLATFKSAIRLQVSFCISYFSQAV